METISVQTQTISNPHDVMTFENQIKICFDFSKLSNQTKNILTKVYTTLAINLIMASLGAYFCINIYRPHFILQIILTVGATILLGGSASMGNNNNDQSKRFLLLMITTFLFGVTSGDMIGIYISIDPSIVLSAFLYTCSIFVTFTMFTLISNDNRKIIYYGSLIFSFCILNLFLLISSFFFNIPTGILKSIISSAVLIIGVLYIIFDTQLMIYKIENLGNHDYISHSLIMFLDFIDIFRAISSILANKEDSKKKSK